MTNEELVSNIICKHCSIGCNKEEEKENCDAFLDALQIANEKDKQYKLKENEINIIKCGSYTTRTRS